MPIIVVDDIFRKMYPKTYHAPKKDEHTIAENENSSADFNNHKSPNPNEGIRRRNQASTDGLGSTEQDEKPNEDGTDSIENEQSNEDDLVSTEELNLEEPDLFRPLKIDWFLAPIFVMIFGYHNTDQCPGNFYVPYMVILIGLLYFATLFCVSMDTNCLIFDCLKKSKRMVLKILSVLFVCVWIFEFALSIFMNVSFDSSADNYCDFTFYIFTIVMNACVLFGVFVVLGLLPHDPDFFNRTSSESPRPAYRLFPFESDSDSDSS